MFNLCCLRFQSVLEDEYEDDILFCSFYSFSSSSSYSGAVQYSDTRNLKYKAGGRRGPPYW